VTITSAQNPFNHKRERLKVLIWLDTKHNSECSGVCIVTTLKRIMNNYQSVKEKEQQHGLIYLFSTSTACWPALLEIPYLSSKIR